MPLSWLIWNMSPFKLVMYVSFFWKCITYCRYHSHSKWTILLEATTTNSIDSLIMNNSIPVHKWMGTSYGKTFYNNMYNHSIKHDKGSQLPLCITNGSWMEHAILPSIKLSFMESRNGKLNFLLSHVMISYEGHMKALTLNYQCKILAG